MQAGFIAMYEWLLNRLSADEPVYFADVTHPWYQTTPPFGWLTAESSPALTTTAQSRRVIIHGAHNLENFDAPFIEPTSIAGVSEAHLLAKIEARNPDNRLINVIWGQSA